MTKLYDWKLTCDNICDDAGELCVASDELSEYADNLVPLDLNKHELLVRNRYFCGPTLSRTACHISS